MQRLVEEKVNAFWKGLESVAPKRGEVRSFVSFATGHLRVDRVTD